MNQELTWRNREVGVCVGEDVAVLGHFVDADEERATRNRSGNAGQIEQNCR